MAPTKVLILILAAWAGCPMLACAGEKTPPVKDKTTAAVKGPWLRFQQIHDLLEEPLDMKFVQMSPMMTLKGSPLPNCAIRAGMKPYS